MQRLFFLLVALLLFISSSTAETITFLTHYIKPFTYEEQGEIKGFAVDVVREMMQMLHHPQEFRMVPFARGLRSVQTTTSYQALFITARRPEREETLKWVGPLINNGVYFYQKRGSRVAVKTLDDAKEIRSIGVGRGNADHSFLKAQGFINLIPTNDQQQSLEMLCLGRVDMTPMGELVMPQMAEEAKIEPSCIERTQLKLYDSVLYLAFSKETPDAEIMKWQEALDALKISGKYAEIYQRYVHE